MEAELVTRAQAGDEAAFQALIDMHRQAVFRLCYLMLRDAQAAEDMAQETFLRAYQNLHRFEQGRPLRPWLLTIAANLCRNHLRSLKRYWDALWAIASVHDDEARLSPEQQVIQRGDVQAVLDAIQQLRPAEREIIYLRYFLEMDVETTAQILDVRPGTVKSRLHRALKRLEFVITRQSPALAEEMRS